MKNKIKNYLLKQKEITLKTESSTGSIYFKLHNETVVRVSDHINPNYNEYDKLNIVVSADGEGCVIILGNRVLQFDKYEKVREWLKFYIKSSYCLKLIPKIKTVEVKKEVEVIKEVETPVYKNIDIVNPDHQRIISLLNQIHPDYDKSIIKSIEDLTRKAKSVSYVNNKCGNIYTRNGVDFDLSGLTKAQRLQVIGTNLTSDKLKRLINKYLLDNSLKEVKTQI